MAERAINPEEFEALLRHLGADRDEAGRHYEQLRSRLVTVFTYRRCAAPEVLADQTLDRVARRVAANRQDEWADLTAFVYGVAWNVARESFRAVRQIPISDDLDPPSLVDVDESDVKERAQACLDRCLARLAAEDRTLLLAYFENSGGAKIRHRSLLAKNLQITPNALRLRIHRSMASVRPCMARCLASEKKGS
jgi:DNA-directed RNA polymerase specialized sigma24 family protein